jgi:hypothetical protein
MFKRISLFKKKAGLTRDEFIKYYEEKHLPLCMSLLPPPKMHRRNYPVLDDPLGQAMRNNREPAAAPEYDCISEVIHETRQDAEIYFQALSDPKKRALIAADEINFIEPGTFKIFIVEVRELAAP